MRLDPALRTALAGSQSAPQLQKLQKATAEMEASFMKQMLSVMRSASQEDPKGQQYGGQTFRDMCDDALANAVTGRVGLGIGREVMKSAGPEVIRQRLEEMNRELRAKTATNTTVFEKGR
ncbi:MAG: rod-binding protein [Fimbriimonas sp.]